MSPSTVTSLSILLAASSPITATHLVDPSFKLDVHSHVIPDIYRSALIAAGYPVVNGTVYTDGFPVPAWDLQTHVEGMDASGISYSTLSVSAPGVMFLADDPPAAAGLARQLNEAMHNYTQLHPTRLGAMCILPLPDVDLALAEARHCLDALSFDGVGLYTNSAGLYLGDAALNPIFEFLNNRSATVFVHPSAPGCGAASLGYPDPMTEYPFESVRAMENLLLTGQRANYSAISIIFPHGGGVMPYLASRIAWGAALSVPGSPSIADSLAQFKGYLFDTASATKAIQLVAMKAFFGDVSRIVTGTDYPYIPLVAITPALASVKANGGFNDTEMALINNQNALNIFPGVATKLGFSLA